MVYTALPEIRQGATSLMCLQAILRILLGTHAIILELQRAIFRQLVLGIIEHLVDLVRGRIDTAFAFHIHRLVGRKARGRLIAPGVSALAIAGD